MTNINPFKQEVSIKFRKNFSFAKTLSKARLPCETVFQLLSLFLPYNAVVFHL